VAEIKSKDAFFARPISVRHTMGTLPVLIRAVSAALLMSLPATAFAWVDAPLCALEDGPVLLSEPAPGPERLYCALADAPPPTALDEPASRDALARDALAGATPGRTEAETAVALLRLDVLAEAHPALSDWVDLQRADLLLASGQPAEAEAVYLRVVETSPDGAYRYQGRVGRVRAKLRRGARNAEAELVSLGRRYPDLPAGPDLELERARMHERAEDPSAAIRVYRLLDLRSPGTGAAAQARTALERLATEGHAIAPYTEGQRVQRTDELLRWGPLSMAREEIDALLAEPPRSPTHRAKVFYMAAKLARHEGRFEDAERYLGRGSAQGVALGDAEDQERRAGRAQAMARAAASREQEAARTEWSRYKGRHSIGRINSGRLFLMLKRVARAGLVTETNEALAELAGRSLPPRTRLDVAVHAAGVGEPRHLLALLEGVGALGGESGRMARYHEGRALMALGRLVEAEAAFLEVIARDTDATPYYAMWAEQQLTAVRAAMIGSCGANASCVLRPSYEPSERSAKPEGAASLRNGLGEGRLDAAAIRPTDLPATVESAALAERLAPIAAAHGDALPWLPRAEAFLRLGLRREAGQQLYEAFLAWREATGRPIRRCGLESVARGAERPRSFVSWQVKRDRRALTTDQRATLTEVAYAVGDVGAATGFGGWDEVQERPRAHARLVEEAAARHGLDPNLLFAVMRVESVYQTEIVSYAGAIGLAQIMPRTGTLIAMERGLEDFTPADLLKPEVNLDFAAWYLRSLIDRFDGHLPLAIASYNGGPHNVRKWLAEHPSDMPLDAFLEHIPFDQTHRYVRRVLTHYRAYRAQQGLPMIALSTELPPVEPDPVGF